MNKDLERLLELDFKNQDTSDYADGISTEEYEEMESLKSKLESILKLKELVEERMKEIEKWGCNGRDYWNSNEYFELKSLLERAEGTKEKS